MCLSKSVFKLAGFAFVDDADLICSGVNAQDVIQSTQAQLEEWRALMEVTGGAVETRRSYYYVIDYIKHKGKWKAFDPDLGDKELIVLDKDKRICSLDRLPCSEAAEMLGVWMTMNGDRRKTDRGTKN